MNFFEYYNVLSETLPHLQLNGTYSADYKEKIFKGQKTLKKYIENLEEIELFSTEIDILKKSLVYSGKDEIQVANNEAENLMQAVVSLRNKVELILDIVHSSNFVGKEDLLFIKLPEFKSFEELSKYSRDLQKAIEIPILDDAINGEVNIIGADKGSVILYVTLGTIAAVKLVAGICWAAAVLRKKNAEAKAFEEHAKTLELKNDALSSLIDAQKQQLKNIAEAEATALANGLLNHNDPETVARLKLSMEIISNMIDKGAKIIPMTTDKEVQNSFPNYNELNLIESSIRQLQSGG